MKVNITIEKNILNTWQKEVMVSSVTAKGCSISFNTLKKAINTGICTQSTYEKINAYVLKSRKNKELLTNKK